MICTQRALLAWAFVVSAANCAFAQTTSVRPGINDSFRTPDVSAFQQRFETESREVFKLRQEIVVAAKITPGKTVADIGAGTGLFTRLFAEAVGADGKVIAVDISKAFLEHIERTSREAGFRNVETQLGKDESVQLPAESIDVAFICDTYHHFEYPLKTLSSIERALKRDGRLILIDFRRILGESSDFVMGHVRAGEDVFVSEIISAGFRKTRVVEGLLKENYFIEFEKSSTPSLTPLEFPLIKDAGGIVRVDKPKESLRSGSKVVFDVTTNSSPNLVNKGIERAARLLNLGSAAGLKPEDVKITIVLHGDATKCALSDDFYKARFQTEQNPNLSIIRELKKAGVDVLVCGQALNSKGFPQSVVAQEISVADAAMSVIINRQTDGYAYVPVP